MWCTVSIDIKIFLNIFIRSTSSFSCSSIVFFVVVVVVLFFCFSPWYSIASACFWKFFPEGEYVNLACSITLLWSEGSISSPLRYSDLSTFLDGNVDFFAAYLLISCYSFSSLTLLSVVMISVYSLCERFLLKRSTWCKISINNWKRICFFSAVNLVFYKDSESLKSKYMMND